MPLTINVGLSRKTSQNYNSEGVSINLTAELDQSLLARPDQLQCRINELYQQAGQALDRQADGSSPARSTPRRDNGRNGHAAAMTQSQRRAIDAIAHRLGLDAHNECRQQMGLELDDLTVRQASQLIDHLKGLTQTAAGNGGHR